MTKAVVAKRADYEKLPTRQLRKHLVDALKQIALHYLEVAHILAILEERGTDLTPLRRRLGWTLHFLLLLADGTLAPKAFERFAGCKYLLNVVARLPLKVQRELARGQKVALADPKNAKLSHLVDPLELTRAEIAQVFADGAIRTEDEQRAWLKENPPKPQLDSKPKHTGKQKSDNATPLDEAKTQLAILRDQFGHLTELAALWKVADSILNP
jgi:hypothetical protein